MVSQSLIYCPLPKVNAKIRLVCFPYAGGSASIYFSWMNKFPDDVELAFIQMPGRGMRFGQPLYQSIDQLVDDVVNELTALPPKDLFFYGHSMGARVAYEVTLSLLRKKRHLPIHVVVAGSIAPCVTGKIKRSYNLPDAEFIQHLTEIKGTPQEIISNSELMELVLPALRADFKIVETYFNDSAVVIPTRISVFSGKQDDIDEIELKPWFTLFDVNDGITWFDGGHFFIKENSDELIAVLNRKIKSHLHSEIDLTR